MQCVIKSHQIIVYGATLLVKIWGPWTRSRIGGPWTRSMKWGPWTRSTEGVHGPGVHVMKTYFQVYKEYIASGDTKTTLPMSLLITKL